MAWAIYGYWVFWDLQLPLRWQIYADYTPHALSYAYMPLRQLRAVIAEISVVRDRLNPNPNLEYDTGTYKEVNKRLMPILKVFGFRSLAQFEAAYAAKGGKMKLFRVGSKQATRKV